MGKTASAVIFDQQIGENFMPAIVIEVDRLQVDACDTDWIQSFMAS
jgi:hypothetical protein